jgi:hypothetical protein
MTVLVGGGQRKTLAKSQASRFHDGGCGRVDEAVEGFADSRALSSEADRGDSLGCWRKGEDPEPSVVWGVFGSAGAPSSLHRASEWLDWCRLSDRQECTGACVSLPMLSNTHARDRRGE